jgi:hypothetical protein
VSSTTLSFFVESTDQTVPLGLEVWLDDQLLLNVPWVKNKVNFSHNFSDSDGEHCLTVVMKNKTSQHTVVSETGSIISDACLLISTPCFDDLELGQIFIEQSEYTHDFNSNGPKTTEKFYGQMGCNGSVTLKFNTPIYLWLLENM